MKKILQEQFGVDLDQMVSVEGLEGYTSNDGWYVVIPADHVSDEDVIEQRAICEFLRRKNIQQVALPILSKDKKLKVQTDQSTFMVSHINPHAFMDRTNVGEFLSNLHKVGSDYPYEPSQLSRYGKWKLLWEQKFDVLETYYQQKLKERPSTQIDRLYIETFPYVLGLTENAIQYLQESEQDWRYHQHDRGTITLQRFQSNHTQAILSNQLVFDHPTRDIAEWVRTKLLSEGRNGFSEVSNMLTSYERNYPLSIFGWRLLYARLVFPIHFFDQIGQFMNQENIGEDLVVNYRKLLDRQVEYEYCLKHFYDYIGFDHKKHEVPSLDW